MTTQELIEMSLLDALALLDAHEREAFDRALSTAAPHVQAHVRREQTRLSRVDLLLPEVSPPAGLRAAVLEAVRRAMAEPEVVAALPSDLSAGGRASRVWRAVSIGLATAATILAGTTLYLQAQYRDLNRSLQGDTILAELSKKFGGRFVNDVLFDADTQRVVFRPQAGFKGEAAFFTNPDWKDKARFFCKDIQTPPGQVYKLALIDGNGNMQVLADITSDGLFQPRDIEFTYRKAANFAIVGPDEAGTGTVILSRGELKPAA
ncbi:MAG: anti-sigma factor [Phycisphaerales bacterium]|nr:anti-sigma factor [Phycisphaerales bacterium]